MSQRHLFNVIVQSALDKSILDTIYTKCLIHHKDLKEGFSSQRIKQMKDLNAGTCDPYKLWFNDWSCGCGIEWSDDIKYIPTSGNNGMSLSLQDDLELIYNLLNLEYGSCLATVILQINKELIS